MSRLIDLIGKRFGRLVVIRKTETKDKCSNAWWLCKCDCGEEIAVRSISLRNGTTQSCGCYRSDYWREQWTKHGMSDSRLARIWYGMKERCNCPTCPAYENYGGRGIQVCDEWLNSFQSFYDWAMTNGYNDNLSIDRIDNDKGYSPDNCRWATNKEQSNNRRSCRIITFNGETHTMYEWAKILGMSYKTLNNRINCLRWSIEKALTQPTK